MSKLSEAMLYLRQSRSKSNADRFASRINSLAKELSINPRAEVTEDVRRRIEEAFLRIQPTPQMKGTSYAEVNDHEISPTSEEIED